MTALTDARVRELRDNAKLASRAAELSMMATDSWAANHHAHKARKAYEDDIIALLDEVLAGREFLAPLSERQREHVQILTRPDIGWKVSVIVLERDGEFDTTRVYSPQSAK